VDLRFAIDILALFACSVYCTIPLFWLVVHPFIGSWRKYGRRAYAWILPLWACFIAAAFCACWRFRLAHFFVNWWAWVPASLLFVLGLWIYRAAFRSFDKVQVSGLAELEPERHTQALITSGIRARVRHPIYLGHLCEVLGWCIGTGLVPLYGLAAFAVATGAAMLHIEDRELEQRFGEQYREYKRAVPAVLPRIRGR
jgi:protein-S-isoprenylcysteine O-methyltransferase Ste14